MLFYEVSAWLLAVLRAWRTVREDVKFWDNPKKSLNYIIFSQGVFFEVLPAVQADQSHLRVNLYLVSALICLSRR